MSIIDKITKTAKAKNAVILAHNYQLPEIQDIADYTGDSLELSRIAAGTEADIIVFCGVHFMAESAAILSPDKKVLLPAAGAGCPMADMAEADDLVRMKAEHPAAKVVTYINSSAAVKAESDVICTSANAKLIVDKTDADEIIFVPDRNLASYVQRFTEKRIIPWQGFCPTHERFSLEDLERIRALHPDAPLIAHPECRPEIIDRADKVLSTGEMVRYAASSTDKKLIIATERDMIHRLKKANPAVEYIPASDDFVCPNMKKITLEILLESIESEKYVIRVDEGAAVKALAALQKMLELSGGIKAGVYAG
jgi:quinolinate synthase